MERQDINPGVNSFCHWILETQKQKPKHESSTAGGFYSPPLRIAFSPHYLCFLSISQAIVLEIICVSLIGVACVAIVTVWVLYTYNFKYLSDKKSLLIFLFFSLENQIGKEADFISCYMSVLGGYCHTQHCRVMVNAPVVKSRLGHSLEKCSYQHPAEDSQSLPDDGWKGRLSLLVVQLRKLHETAAYL